tara:strand:- start:424 stop:639 length:216 start_codon:yes stop_codon:yes gene_type:complete
MTKPETAQLSLKLGFKPLTQTKKRDDRAASAAFLGKTRKDIIAEVHALRTELRQIGDAVYAKLLELEGRGP